MPLSDHFQKKPVKIWKIEKIVVGSSGLYPYDRSCPQIGIRYVTPPDVNYWIRGVWKTINHICFCALASGWLTGTKLSKKNSWAIGGMVAKPSLVCGSL